MTHVQIPLRHDSAGRAGAEYVAEVLNSGAFQHGRVATRLELLAAKSCGGSQGVALSSLAAASGLLGAWLSGTSSLASRPGEILVSPFTSPTIIAPLSAAGFRVKPVDVNPGSLTLDPKAVASRINEQTRAVVFCHTYGNPGSISEVARVAARAEVVLIEDVTLSIGTLHAGRAPGQWGRVAVLALDAESPISAGGGAIVVTDDTSLANDLRNRRHGAEPHGLRGVFSGQGLSELQAAVALARLEDLESTRDRRAAIADRYVRNLLRVKGVIVPTMDEATNMLWSDFHVRLEPTYAEDERDRIVRSMRAHDVMVEAPRDPAFPQTLDPSTSDRTPMAASVAQRIIRLPMHAALSDREVDLVVQTLEVILARENLSRG